MTDTTNYITSNIDKWTDEETLENFFNFFPRVGQVSQLVQNDEGAVVAQVLVTFAGNKAVYSEPVALDWPLMPIPAPEGNVVTIN